MKRNLALSVVNILVIGLPILLTWGFEGYLVAIFVQTGVCALLFWNIVGDFILINFVFHGKTIPQNAQMRPPIAQYIHYIASTNKIGASGVRMLMYADSKLPFFIPISKSAFIVSLALQDSLIEEGSILLSTHIPDSMLEPQQMYSRKFMLLTIFGYKVILRFMELWAIIFAVAVKIIMSIVMLIATGALFGTLDDMICSISLGSAIGDIVLKINNAVNYIQDRLVEVLLKETVSGHLGVVERELSIK